MSFQHEKTVGTIRTNHAEQRIWTGMPHLHPGRQEIENTLGLLHLADEEHPWVRRALRRRKEPGLVDAPEENLAAA